LGGYADSIGKSIRRGPFKEFDMRGWITLAVVAVVILVVIGLALPAT
jgi:hypothetical protein